MTPGLVRTLVKVYAAVSEKRVNEISKKELQLTHSEYGNFQKLRFHGLIAKYKPEGVWEKGKWLMTSRGADFLKGNLRIPDRVQTFRNRVTDHAEDYVSVKDVIGTEPYWDSVPDFAIAALPEDVAVQYDERGQGMLAI